MNNALKEKLPLLKISDLKQHFVLKREVMFQPKQVVKAVDGINFSLFPGETLSIEIGRASCRERVL